MDWLLFKEWFLMQGSIYTMWILYFVAIALAISCNWPRNLREREVIKFKEEREEFKYIRRDIGKEARKGLAYIFAFCATAILIYSIFPFNWTVLYNIGG